MNEQEIVSYLKANRNQGIAYPFYPDAVKEWIDNHWYVIIEYRYNLISNFYHWVKHHDNEPAVASNDVYALPEDFELPPKPQKPQSGWVEFEIKSGVFTYDGRCFDWWDWGCFLNYCKGCNTDNFTDFGGWQYEGFLSWYMQPMLRGKGNKKELRNYEDNHEESTPAIPVKIRFWREVK